MGHGGADRSTRALGLRATTLATTHVPPALAWQADEKLVNATRLTLDLMTIDVTTRFAAWRVRSSGAPAVPRPTSRPLQPRSQPNQIVGGGGEGQKPVHPLAAPIPKLPQSADSPGTLRVPDTRAGFGRPMRLERSPSCPPPLSTCRTSPGLPSDPTTWSARA